MIKTKLTKTREQLVQMYIDSLKESQLPWRMRWNSGANINGITNLEYKGINQLMLTLVAAKEHYGDPRWLTYVQIKKKGYKLVNAKNKGVPIEFWSVYDFKNKKKISFPDYEKIIAQNPDDKDNYKVICKTTMVFNAFYIDGLPKLQSNNKEKVVISKYINNLIHKFRIKYSEYGNRAFYKPSTDEIVLPSKDKFVDNYSYYATQLHELCHATGNEKRLNRNLCNGNQKDYAREELIAEISSSFLMQRLNVDTKAKHYDNHKAYIQSWISILEDTPSELFKAINESNKVVDYINEQSKNKERNYER